LGCGGTFIDYLATVASFPSLDDKIRSLTLKMQGVATLATQSLRLHASLRPSLPRSSPRIHSSRPDQVANDAQGRSILNKLKSNGMDTSYILVTENDNSPFTYIIIDEQTQRKIPILIDVEKRGRAGQASQFCILHCMICKAWTRASSIHVVLVSMLSRLPNIKFVIVTLGEKVRAAYTSMAREIDVEALFESLEKKVDHSSTIPKLGSISGRLLLSTTEVIPLNELVHTTGTRDKFIGAVPYDNSCLLSTGAPDSP
ncbi:hypothetical protein ACJX0J_031499, partial [Zea mays]